MIGIAINVTGALLRPRRRAHGHTGEHSYAVIEIEGSDVSGTVQFPVDHLNEVLGTSLPLDEQGATSSVETDRAKIEVYVHDHFSVGDESRRWPVVITGFRVMERRRFTYLIFEYRVEPRLDRLPTRFTVTFDGIVHAKSDAEAMVIVRRPAGYGPLHTSNQQEFLASSDGTTHDVVIPEASWHKDVTGAVSRVVGSVDEVVRRGLKRFGIGRSRRRRTM